METFYQALPYVLIFAQCAGAAKIARHFARTRPLKSRWRVVLLAPLPIPGVIVGSAVFAFKFAAGAKSCAIDACAAGTDAFNTLFVSAVALYLIGIITALMGYRSGKLSVERARAE